MSDVMLFTTQGEGFCLPAFEAAACGTPIVAPRWSALGELFDGVAELAAEAVLEVRGLLLVGELGLELVARRLGDLRVEVLQRDTEDGSAVGRGTLVGQRLVITLLFGKMGGAVRESAELGVYLGQLQQRTLLYGIGFQP
jgi:hypothetical protein